MKWKPINKTTTGTICVYARGHLSFIDGQMFSTKTKKPGKYFKIGSDYDGYGSSTPHDFTIECERGCENPNQFGAPYFTPTHYVELKQADWVKTNPNQETPIEVTNFRELLPTGDEFPIAEPKRTIGERYRSIKIRPWYRRLPKALVALGDYFNPRSEEDDGQVM